MSSAQGHSSWQLPLQWPRDAGGDAREEALRTARVLKAAVVFALLALTVLDRFGLRLTTEFSIPPGLMAMYALAVVMLFTGAAELNPRGALAYVAVVSVAGLSYLVNSPFQPRAHLSLDSFLLLAVLYAPFAVSLGRGAGTHELWRWTVRMYIAFSLFLAVAGITQFLAQFFYRPEWLFDYSALIPEAIRASGGWNTVYAMEGWIKSNGFFLREPSIFSVAMALAILLELGTRRRTWALAVLGAGLLLTYSGAGLLCLGVAMLFPLGPRTVLRLAGLAALAAAVYFILGDVLNLSYTLARAGEITSESSSAYCRFVYPGVATLQQLDADPWTSLLGHGPGTMVRMGATCADGHQTTYGKLLFEYGLLGTLAFGALLAGALNRSGAPMRIRAALAITWLFLGGNLLASELLLAIYLLSAMWPERTA
jgi:hypothetical protein